MLRFALAAVLLLHGFAHLVGFLGPFRIGSAVPYKTTVLNGRVDLGDAGIRVLGVAWLLGAIAFWIVALGAVAGGAWWPTATAWVALVSLVLSIVNYPDSKGGVVVNAALLILLAAAVRSGWV